MGGQPDRDQALDGLRGLTVLLMIPVNAGLEYAAIPAWLKHAPGAGMRLADFIMPAFLVAMGVSASFSLGKRLARDGAPRTILHALLRYGLLFAFGSIGYLIVWRGTAWEVLQMLGATGALAFPLMFLPPLPRLGAAFALVAAVELLRPAFFDGAYRAWYSSGLGGPAGTFALASLPLAASALGELMRPRGWKGRAVIAAGAGAALVALGLVASAWAVPDKHLLSPAYLLISSGAAFLALALLEGPSAAWGELPLLGAIGRNPLLAYMGSGLLILALRALLPAGASPPLAWAGILLVLLLVAAICLVLDRKKVWIKL